MDVTFKCKSLHGQASHAALWAMPAAQVALLGFFGSVAAWHWWYNWALLGPCFVTGELPRVQELLAWHRLL